MNDDSHHTERRKLGTTDIEISTVAMGCWPIAGMTSLNVNDEDSLRTLKAAVDTGVNFFDTAHCYGRNGESERLIAQSLISGSNAPDRSQLVLATKGGIQWGRDGKQILDGSPATLQLQCEESLRRLQTEYIDLLYLHAPDPKTPVAKSAEAMRKIMESGKTRSIGVSNFNLQQLHDFHAICPVTAIQPPYNMLQRQIEKDIIPWCVENQVSVLVYWPLMKGLLAGKLRRDHQFQPGDGRPKYAMFQGDEWRKNQDFVDQLRIIANELGKSVAQIVVNWTINQPGITAALCGAKRATQIEETAGAMGWKLDAPMEELVNTALQQRGTPVPMSAV
ncbi:MAG: aldo/keto reductase [Planctomycetota bacterium]|nr:aldo/keto reductase [Planctomycetota bacterium]